MSDGAFMIRPLAYSPTRYGSNFTCSGANWYFTAGGHFQSTGGANIPRWDNDPVTGLPIGLRVEGAGSNYVPNADLISGAAGMSFPFGGVTSSVDAAVQGVDTGAAISCRKLVVTADSVVVRFSSDGVGTTGGTSGNYYAGSIWIKQSGASPLTGNISVNGYAVTANDFAITSTFKRVKAKGLGANTSRYFDLKLPAGTYYVWGAQLEDGGKTTSYMGNNARLAVKVQ